MNKQEGGKPFAAGGFGCAFKPALTCPNQPQLKNGISKLMRKRHVEDEMAEYARVKQHTSTIPKSSNYFLIDGITSCIEPNKIEKNDLEDFDNVCTNLVKHKYTTKNINYNLEKLGIINMPYGGPDLDVYWGNKWKPSNSGDFIATNNALIRLLKNAIIPLNQKRFFHLDIKGPNILRSEENGHVYCRLIDWGLSGNYKSPYDMWKRYRYPVLQYNLPFGIVLLDHDLTWLNEQISKLMEATEHLDYSVGKRIMMRQLAQQVYERNVIGRGHDAYLRNVFVQLYNTRDSELGSRSLEEFMKHTIVNNLSTILTNYTDASGNFNSEKYVEEVLYHNIDIHGFLLAYLKIPKTFKYSSIPNVKKLSNAISRILAQYCFGILYATRKIPVNTLINDLLSLNKIVGGKAVLDPTPPESSYKMSLEDVNNNEISQLKKSKANIVVRLSKKKTPVKKKSITKKKPPCKPGKIKNENGRCVLKKNLNTSVVIRSLNCNSNFLKNIYQELFKRMYLPVYIALIGLIASLILLKSKNTQGYFSFKIKIFLTGIFFIILSDILLNYTGNKIINNLIYIVIPVFSFLIIYQILFLKLRKKK